MSYYNNSNNLYNQSVNFRGRLIIINNEEFQDPKLEKREGTDKDTERLKKSFQNLGFEAVEYKNQTTTQMLQIMTGVTSSSFGDYDCLAVAILTHGAGDGHIYGTNMPTGKTPNLISLEGLFGPLKEFADGKPKLVFVQACRGGNIDQGREVMCDDDGDEVGKRKFIKLPMESDFLYHYSSSPGYYSFRNSKGSIFIQALCNVIDDSLNHEEEMELMKLLTRVNRKVAEEYTSNVKIRPELDGKKQMPSIVSMLRKDIILKKKKVH